MDGRAARRAAARAAGEGDNGGERERAEHASDVARLAAVMPSARVCPHALEIGIRVAHLGQIGRPGLGVQLLEERVVARIGLRLHDPARWVPKIAELDCRGRAGLLAGRLDVAVTKLAPRELRIDLHPIDPLRAVGALLHDAPRADRDVRVHRELEDVGRVLGEVEEIEAAHLVGTVVRAVAGPDAPVVDHHVEALRVVDGRGHGADLLAGSVLAVHAGNRLEDDLRAAGGLAGEVPVDPDPVHLAPLRDLDLADDRHVVLALAGRPCTRCSRCRSSGRSSSPTGGPDRRHAPSRVRSDAVPPRRRRVRGTLPLSGLVGILRMRALGWLAPRRPISIEARSAVDSRTTGRPSMLPCSWVAESGYVRASLVSLTPLSKPGALELRTVNASNPTPEPIRPACERP